MKWKIFITAFISGLFAIFPENIIGCGPSEDPYDYYTSFFDRDIVAKKSLQPFYYTGMLNFYTDEMQENEQKLPSNENIINEWRKYCNNEPTKADTRIFVYKTSPGVIANIQNALGSNAANKTAGVLDQNSMATYLVRHNNLPAFSYLFFAKQTENLSVSTDWSPRRANDSILVNGYISKARELAQGTKDEFIKSKYRFQLCKLAFYNARYKECAQWYDDYFPHNINSATQELALGYKAGSLFRLKRYKEAAYAYSLLFPVTENKKMIFQGFLWCTEYCDPSLQDEYLSLCKNDKERANMVAMFGMFGTSYKLANLRKLYALDPVNSLLPLLATREISKLEEKYLTPALAKEKGGKPYFYSGFEDENISKDKEQLELLRSFFETLAHDTRLNDRSIYLCGAAYLSLLSKQYNNARKFIEEARALKVSDKTKDQLELINVLIMANEPAKLDAKVEQAILPSLQWLSKKAAKNNDYNIFLRNLLSEIIAQRYEQQRQPERAALAYGVADHNKGGWMEGLNFIHDEMSTSGLLNLYALFTANAHSPYEDFLIKNSVVTKNDVINTIGTSYLREFNFKKAVEWLEKSTERKTLVEENYNYQTQKTTWINIDPFYDYVNDYERYKRSAKTPYTKLTLAQKLLEIQSKINSTSEKETKAKLYYQLATGLYNTSYYGNAWEAISYFRRTSAWNTGEYNTPWEKEYYNLDQSRAYYQKAYELTSNKEFKAACYFLVIKCAQRQIIAPGSAFWGIEESTDPEMKAFWKKFKYNPLFANFQKQFGDTKYFSYVTTRCSYLRDFVAKNK